MSIKSTIVPALAAAALTAIYATPAPAAAQTLPSYARAGGDTIHGRVSGFDGKYDLSVRDDRGFVDHVKLHDGTVILPTGLTLRPGMRVTISGRPDGPVLLADEVDTPYRYAYPRVAYYPYPVYPYPAYGYPYWGPAYGIGLGFHFH